MTEQQVTEAAVQDVLAEFKDPETGRSVTQLQQIHGLQLEGEKLAVTLGLTSWSAPLWDETGNKLAELLRRKFSELEVDVSVELHDRPAEAIGEVALTAKSVVAIGSGKGGVGKSSVALILAYGLAKAGCKVGLMDADIYGPSIPHLLGPVDRPVTQRGDRIQPVEVDGLKVMSIGFMVPTDQAVIWRGPMLHGVMNQFLRDTDWGDLDYLIVDMPPGTGDIPLSLSQLLPLTGTAIVCTPQDVALLDAVRAIAMFRKIDIPVLGMVENMSFFLCPECDSRHEIFGSGGAKQKAAELGMPFLGEIPLNAELRVLGDEGKLRESLEHQAAGPYLEAICHSLVRELADKQRQQPAMPKLTVLGQ